VWGVLRRWPQFFAVSNFLKALNERDAMSNNFKTKKNNKKNNKSKTKKNSKNNNNNNKNNKSIFLSQHCHFLCDNMTTQQEQQEQDNIATTSRLRRGTTTRTTQQEQEKQPKQQSTHVKNDFFVENDGAFDVTCLLAMSKTNLKKRSQQ